MKLTYYIGKEKVKEFKVAVNTDLVGVLFENGKKEDFTSEQWDNIKDKKPYDDNMVLVRKHEKMLQRVIKDLVISRVTIGEQAWILERLNNSIGENYKNAIAKVFGVSIPEKIMLFQIDEALKK